jgi:hypothetical protein
VEDLLALADLVSAVAETGVNLISSIVSPVLRPDEKSVPHGGE